MNDKLKRRLAGAALLLVAAFIVVSLLPTPEQTAHQAGVEVVTIPLHDVISAAPPPTATTTLPQTLAAPDDSPAPSVAALAGSGDHNGDGTAAQDLDSSGGDDDAGESPPSPASKPVTLAMSPALQHDSAPADLNPPPAPKPEAKPKPEPKPAAVEAPKPAPAKPAASPPPPATGQKWFVQVGGFADIDNARKVQARLQDISQPNVLAPIDTPKGTIYRVRAGPYASQAAARQAFDKIAAQGFTGSKLINP